MARIRIPLEPVAAKRRRSVLALLAGVVLPVATLLVEMQWGLCREDFFDPLPNWRWMLVAWLVPLGNLLGWLGYRTRVASLLNGVALFVSLGYAAMFNVLLIPAVVLIPMGLGLLPWSTVAAFAVAVHQRRLGTNSPMMPGGAGMAFAAGAAAILFAAGPMFWTDYWMAAAAKSGGADRERAVAMLRRFADLGHMRAACIDRNRWWYFRARIMPIESQRLHYVVTGEAYPPPPMADGLRLSSSRIQGRAMPAAGHQYLEWTMEFANASRAQQEAVAVIELPEGGVVSRVTLWIDGEEREAAFGGRSQTRAAYDSVVSTRRDPLLVQTAGPGRVRAQCFPVPPGGAMKIRLGVAAPMRGDRPQLPRIVERNFEIGDTRDDVALERLAGEWSPPVRAVDPVDPRFAVVQQTRAAEPQRTVVVLDGSASMARLGPVARSHASVPVVETGDYRGGPTTCPLCCGPGGNCPSRAEAPSCGSTAHSLSSSPPPSNCAARWRRTGAGFA